jgi:hypothetical protein
VWYRFGGQVKASNASRAKIAAENMTQSSSLPQAGELSSVETTSEDHSRSLLLCSKTLSGVMTALKASGGAARRKGVQLWAEANPSFTGRAVHAVSFAFVSGLNEMGVPRKAVCRFTLDFPFLSLSPILISEV